MAITYEDAVAKLHEWTDNPALRNHARGVEASMRRAAHRYGAGAADEPRWAIAGLLHDADYDRWPEEHPRRIVAWLREQGEPEIAQAVVAHFDPAEVPELTALDKALLACDELTGFVMACCLVRPDGIRSLSPSSVKKKLKDKSFAAKVNRDDVYGGVERLGVPAGRAHPARHRRPDAACRDPGHQWRRMRIVQDDANPDADIGVKREQLPCGMLRSSRRKGADDGRTGRLVADVLLGHGRRVLAEDAPRRTRLGRKRISSWSRSASRRRPGSSTCPAAGDVTATPWPIAATT